MKRILKYLVLSLGIIATAMGFIGLFVPVLPTTPFLLLASFCFVRSSERMDRWLKRHRLFGPIIEEYMTNRAITGENRFWALVTLWPTLLITAGLTDKFAVQVAILLMGSAVTLHLLSLKTIDRKAKKAALEDDPSSDTQLACTPESVD